MPPKDRRGAKPMSLADVVGCLNEAFEQLGYGMRLTDASVATAYYATTASCDIWGFLPTPGDQRPKDLLLAMPPDERAACLVVSLDATAKGGPEAGGRIPFYWAIDSEAGEVRTEAEAYRAISRGGAGAPKA